MTTEPQRTTGIVKWFDSKGGFGFITILKGQTDEGKDIFVHYSALTTVQSQYKYLVLGEYVEFVLEKAENKKYEYFAQSVSGIFGGNLMCESRRLSEKIEKTDTRPASASLATTGEHRTYERKPARSARRETTAPTKEATL
jgi:cold shock CspA family protein